MTTNHWRVGRSAGRTIYVQAGDEASKDDMLIGLMDTRALASTVVDAVNRHLEQERVLGELARAEEREGVRAPLPTRAEVLDSTCAAVLERHEALEEDATVGDVVHLTVDALHEAGMLAWREES